MSAAISERARVVKSGVPQGPHLRVLPILGPSHERPAFVAHLELAKMVQSKLGK